MEELEKNEQMPQEKSGMSIASMVLGLVGLIVLAVPCGILAIVFSVLGKKKGGKGFATTGLVLGIVDCAMGAINVIVSVIAAASLF